MQELSRFIKYHKEGNSLIIDEIYNEPLLKIPDKRIQSNKNPKNNKYINEVQDILIEYIYSNQKKGNQMIVSFSKLINILGFANDSYKNANGKKKKELSEVLNIKLLAIYYFYNITRDEFKKIIERALNSLQRRSILEVDKAYCIYEKKDNSYIVKMADEKERGLIIDARYKALSKLGLRDLQELKFAGASAYRKFNSLVKEYLPAEWKFYYQVYILVLGKNAIRNEYIKIQQRKKELNSKSIERMKKCLKVIDEKSDQAQLIDKLISVIGYNPTLDEKINALYKENKEKYYKTLTEKNKQIYAIEREIENIKEQQDAKDDVDIIDLKTYADNIRIQKGNHDFIEMNM